MPGRTTQLPARLPSHPIPPMHSYSPLARLATALCTGALCVVAAACGDPVGPGAPAAPPALLKAAADPTDIHVVALKRRAPLDRDITVSATIGRKGGTLEIREAGIVVKVPSGAVSEPVQFKLTALAGDMIAYEFQPHGIHFRRPLEATQELKQTTLGARKHDPSDADIQALQAAYFPSREKLHPERGTASVKELLPTTLAVHGHRLRWEIWHFSGYMVSSARCK